MIGTDLYVAERSMSLYVDEARREAARLPARGSVRAFAVVVRQLSLLLVSLGGRLVAYGLPPYHPSRRGFGSAATNESPDGAPA
jgi:hypothetical protein